MKLTYWYAECLDDSNAYSVRAKRKRDAQALLTEGGGKYGPLRKVTVEYSDGFDLLIQCLGEGRCWWEYEPRGSL